MTRSRPLIVPLLLSVALLGAEADDPGVELRKAGESIDRDCVKYSVR